MRWILPLFLLGLFVCTGCSNAKSPPGNKIGATKSAAPERQSEPREEAVYLPDAGQEVENRQVAAGQIGVPPGQPVKEGGKLAEKKDKAQKPRKVRYTAEMRLIVEDIDKAADALDESRKEAKGEYAKVEINTSAGAVRSGMWRVRVPVDNLHAFRKAVAKLGEVEHNKLDNEDMTGQYYDLEADIKNRKDAREALRELLKETGKKEMKHYLEVWDKLEAVSGEINIKEGRLKLWEDLTELTTITVNLREKQKYIAVKPPDLAEVPTFGMRSSKTWNDSWDAFVTFLELVALVAIAVTPWLPIPLILGTGVWLIGRRLFRSKPEQVVVLVEAAASKKA
jgi:hypothetical protein